MHGNNEIIELKSSQLASVQLPRKYVIERLRSQTKSNSKYISDLLQLLDSKITVLNTLPIKILRILQNIIPEGNTLRFEGTSSHEEVNSKFLALMGKYKDYPLLGGCMRFTKKESIITIEKVFYNYKFVSILEYSK